MRTPDAPGVSDLGLATGSLRLVERPGLKEPLMQTEVDPGTHTGNLLLDAIPEHERTPLLEDARVVPLEVGRVLFHPGDPVDYVAFPTAGTLSLIAHADELYAVEAATIGLEGVAPVHTGLGSRRASQELVGQVEGQMITVEVETFAKVAGGGAFQAIVAGYLEAMIAQISLTAACNAVHHLEQRCARWLLQTHDRVRTDTFGLTQHFLGVMLGVQRPSVSIAQQTLAKAGCITFHRGSITVTDREALEAAACPCYEMIRSEYSRLVPLHPAR